MKLKKRLLLMLCLVLGIAAVAAVTAGAVTIGSAATATPWVYDPDGLGNSSSVWETAGGQNVLDLQKNAPTESNQAAGATIDGFAGDPLFEVGFDYRGYCGAGAPRINIYYGENTAFFGCAHGTHTALADGWTHVEFGSCEDTTPGDGTNGVLCNGDWEESLVTIDGGDIVQDEQGQVELRNITVDDVTLGPPPAEQPIQRQEDRAIYCSTNGLYKAPTTGEMTITLDLLIGQNANDPAFTGYRAVPAFELVDTHALTCTLPAGYKTTGQSDGIYPLAAK